MIGEHLNAASATVNERVRMMAQSFISKGFDYQSAHERALAILNGSVKVQASVLSFSDTFFVTVIMIVATIPLIFLLGRPNKSVKVDVH